MLLSAIEKERESLSGPSRTLDLQLALVAARAEAVASVTPEWPAEAQQRLARGEPALDLDHLPIDWEAFARIVRQVSHIAARYEPHLSPPVVEVAALVQEMGPGAVEALAVGYLSAGEVPAGLDPALFSFVLTHALHPFLGAHADAAAPLLEGEQWLRGDCPVCGGRPDFAAIDGEIGERRLLCSRCDAEWLFRRVGCPFCGNEEHGSVGYFLAGDEGYRLYVCERCKGYLKTIDWRERWQRRPLPVERILTVGMDLAALAQGYHPSTSVIVFQP